MLLQVQDNLGASPRLSGYWNARRRASPKAMVTCVTVFLIGFRLLAIMAFPALAVAAWLIVRKHSKMLELGGLSLSQKSYYGRCSLS